MYRKQLSLLELKWASLRSSPQSEHLKCLGLTVKLNTYEPFNCNSSRFCLCFARCTTAKHLSYNTFVYIAATLFQWGKNYTMPSMPNVYIESGFKDGKLKKNKKCMQKSSAPLLLHLSQMWVTLQDLKLGHNSTCKHVFCLCWTKKRYFFP